MSQSSTEQRDEQRMEELEKAFEVFTRTSRQLSDSYAELESQVSQLSQELAAARSARLQELAEKERIGRRLEQLLEALPGGVMVIDGQGRIRDANPGAVSLLGNPLEGERWEDIRRRAFIDDTGGTGEVTLRTGRRVSLSQRSLEAEQGRIILLTDVSETRALQELVDRHQRLSAMGEMAARLAHQIRTPLSAALLYAGQLEAGQVSEERLPKLAARVAGRLRQIEGMIGDMLMFAGGGRRDDEVLRLDELFAEAAGQVMTRWRRHIQLKVEGGRGLAIRGSRVAVLGAITNLLNNAAEAVQIHEAADAHVRLRAEAVGDHRVLIRVRDNGKGVPRELRERIFEPFYTTRPQGTGLGLAVVRSVAEAHNGELLLATPKVGGAEFILSLPAVTLRAVSSRSGQSGRDQ
ncbi:sensor histidine kinase [Natronospira bacteriovora]|uniref:histidine kinase n=1 Tax=Natronospira bacteriovora TaxID=3069753 RepID=A0ABU0W3E0_9GAMM|nr:ATP-binding protein [Natronospira sp. AB-CW4]MDQ2068477.1 ATP-binding protein [Natronospira sp. AB-CW4]